MEYFNGLILNRPIMHESNGYPKWIDTRGVKQIYNKKFKTANPLYINYAHTFRTASLRRLSSNKIILACQVLIFTDSKKKLPDITMWYINCSTCWVLARA